jgi:hypothetical protein
MSQRNFENALIFGLVGASMFHPAAACFALLIVFAHQAAERYFTRNIADKERLAIANLTSEVTKHAELLRKQGIAKAFGGQQ